MPGPCTILCSPNMLISNWYLLLTEKAQLNNPIIIHKPRIIRESNMVIFCQRKSCTEWQKEVKMFWKLLKEQLHMYILFFWYLVARQINRKSLCVQHDVYTKISLTRVTTPSGPFYLAQVRMTRSPRLHFDHSFALYYIIYAYKLIING